MIQEICVACKHSDVRAEALLHEIKRTLGIHSIRSIRTAKIYRFEGVSASDAQRIARESLVDPLNETFICNGPLALQADHVIELGHKPGVMNPEVASLRKTVTSLGVKSLKAADSSMQYYFSGELTDDQLQQILDRLLLNKTVSQVVKVKPTTLLIEDESVPVQTIAIRAMDIAQLRAYAKQQQLFMSDAELAAVKQYFIKSGRDPYDAELETIAQTWSEHCCHKTFKAPLIVKGVEKLPLFTRLKQAAAQYSEQTLSAFEDNAGVFRFYDGYGIAGKVETHNSPSALEPYGGAATGSGGVFRDIMGTGQGAKVIASTDMFCFAPPTLEQSDVPVGCLHPDYLLRKVVAGVRDYGNRMGVPTNNGSVHFHKDFRAKPTVIVGAYGIMPEDRCQKGTPRITDRIFAVGGKTGRDGIHGATFSSDAMTAHTSSTSATAVQIGNPIEQKRMADALLAARDNNLIRAVTDCGAGGFSSAIGEMGQELGVHVELFRAPLKYSGLAPWEMWVSESQERMVCAIAPQDAQQFIDLCAQYNVEAVDIGYFTGKKNLLVTYDGQTVCDLDMQFLHEGCPISSLQASGKQVNSAVQTVYTIPNSQKEWIDCYMAVMAHENICSKEPIVRQYDHTVQGMNALAPYAGNDQDAPQDAVVLVPLYGKPYGLIIAHGMNPILNRIDPYAGSWWAITEAMANLVAVGGNPRDVALIDNFIWPKPNGTHLWALDRAVDACVDAMHAFKIPFISGKDSLSSTYRFTDGTALHIPPVLCVSVFGKIPDVARTISSDFKQSDSLLLLIGDLDVSAMGGSIYEEIRGCEVAGTVPHIDPEKTACRFQQLHERIVKGDVRACHDVSEGGIAAAVAEMCFGSKIGARLDCTLFGINQLEYSSYLDQFLFNETTGCFVVEVDPERYEAGVFDEISHTVLGTTTQEQTIAVCNGTERIFDVSIETLYSAWQRPMQEVFNS